MRPNIEKRFFANKNLRICYWNQEPKFASTSKVLFEKLLTRLGDIKLTEVKELDSGDEKDTLRYDLLIISAEHIPEEHFFEWLKKLRDRIQRQHLIWSPAIIVSNVGLDMIINIFIEVVKTNWYFDILSTAHLSSLPMRVANLLRIHDHLHELRRYNEELESMQRQIDKLEQQISAGRT